MKDPWRTACVGMSRIRRVDSELVEIVVSCHRLLGRQLLVHIVVVRLAGKCRGESRNAVGNNHCSCSGCAQEAAARRVDITRRDFAGRDLREAAEGHDLTFDLGFKR